MPVVFDVGSAVGSAANGAMNCAIAVTNIADYEAARFQLSAAASFNKPSGLSSSAFNDYWANQVNTELAKKGFTNVSYAGINVK